MKFSKPQPFLLVQKRTKAREPSGSRLFETMKSSKSRMEEPSPRSWIFDQRLKPKTQGMLSRVMAMPLMMVLFLRSQSKRSMKKAMMPSKTATTVDMAAKVRKMKKTAPHQRPPGIWVKRFGMVMKMRLGPAPGSTPYAKQEGMMMNPAVRATNVSRPVMTMDSPIRLRSLPM